LPDGLRLSNAHTWLRSKPSGGLEVGADSLITYAVGAVARIVLPKPGDQVTEGQPLFRLEYNGAALTVPSSVTGRVMAVNDRLREEPALLSSDPYGSGWICRVDPSSEEKSAPNTRFGEEALTWLDGEFGRFRDFILAAVSPDFALGVTSQDGGLPAAGCLSQLTSATWVAFEEQFLRSR
jgi:glycine cleavage system H protein